MNDFRLAVWLRSWKNSVNTEINFDPFDRVLGAVLVQTVFGLANFFDLAVICWIDAGRLLFLLVGLNTLNG